MVDQELCYVCCEKVVRFRIEITVKNGSDLWNEICYECLELRLRTLALAVRDNYFLSFSVHQLPKKD